MLQAPGVAAATLLVVGSLAAQIGGNGSNGAFTPTAETTLDTTANLGVFQFASIAIPAGVTVHLRGSHAATLLCTGNVAIDGTVEADGNNGRGGPGGYDGGAGLLLQSGLNGGGPGGGAGQPGGIGGPGSPAAHATRGHPESPASLVYGASLPFDLQGGSGGGGASSSWFGIVALSGTGGGGAIALLADGSIQITGRVSARGGDRLIDTNTNPSYGGGSGSGGAILIRSLQCVTITGTVDATGGVGTDVRLGVFSTGGDGWIRIDTYSAACAAPVITGTVRPAPLATAMPFLTELGAARLGSVYRVRCASVPGDVLGYWMGLLPASIPLPPFGVLLVDPLAPGFTFFGQLPVPAAGIDPLASTDLPVPNAPSLAGITLYSQMFNAFGAVTGQARFSNLLTTTLR